MRRIIINVVLILILQGIITSATVTGNETYQLSEQIKQYCGTYTINFVQPMLDYFQNMKEKLQQSEAKDAIIKDLKEKLAYQEINGALIKQLRDQVELQNGIINNLSANSRVIENYGKCKDELAEKSLKLGLLDTRVQKQNPNLYTDVQSFQIKVDKLNQLKAQNQNSNESELSKNYDKCKIELADKTYKLGQLNSQVQINSNVYNDLQSCRIEVDKLNQLQSKSQNDFNQTNVLTANVELSKNYDTCKIELADKTYKLGQLNSQLQQQNSNVYNDLQSCRIEVNKLDQLQSKNVELAKNAVKCNNELVEKTYKLRQLDVQVQQLNSNAHNDLQLCRTEIEKLNQLQSQIDLRPTNQLAAKTKISEYYDQCREELQHKSNNLEICEVELKTLNSGLTEKNKSLLRYITNFENATKYQKTIELQLEEAQTKLLNTEVDQQFCQDKVQKLEKLTQYEFPASCMPFEQDPGVHKIQVSGLDPFDVLCDSETAGPGWTVIQQRVGGNENFNRDWATYRNGFGSLNSDFFLGLEKIHQLTRSRRHELYVHLVGLNGTIRYAYYDDFKIANEKNDYALSLGEFEGDNLDALRLRESVRFSTFDRDNDLDAGDCAFTFESGWWYTHCYNCNLNAVYGPDLMWRKSFILKEAKMLIRPLAPLYN
ncbi:angiopoietin-4-like [Drosophila nasuta]|uniref:angiopoietin-4-like n=1 Tax=Drosophila nasuta TaxID=42062 RepID=UPI00295E27A0|nr:angiopoietin-4-like [Drosophila nasuta]